MPHAILRVTDMTGIIVREFYLSCPEDLQRRVLSMFSGVGLQPQTNGGGEVKFEGEFEKCAGRRNVCVSCVPECGNYLFVFRMYFFCDMVGTRRSQAGSINIFQLTYFIFLFALYVPPPPPSPLQISEGASNFTPSSTG